MRASRAYFRQVLREPEARLAGTPAGALEENAQLVAPAGRVPQRARHVRVVAELLSR